MTSRQVVARVGEKLGESKVGHTGTLDPLATGVLVVCLGRATLLSRYVSGRPKVYRLVALLGIETDTYDIDGRVTARGEAGRLGAADIKREIKRFEGEILQKPPAYSAVKHRGKPLYYYARRGITVEPGLREVSIDRIELTSFSVTDSGPLVGMEITCGPGTYVRSFVHDLGRELGCGACVHELRRIRSGRFSEESAVRLDLILSMAPEEAFSSLLSLEWCTDELPTVVATEEGSRAAALGAPLRLDQLCTGLKPVGVGEVFRVLDGDRRLLALYGPPRSGDDTEIIGRPVRVIRPMAVGAL